MSLTMEDITTPASPLTPRTRSNKILDAQQIEQGTDLVLKMLFGASQPVVPSTIPPAILNLSIPTVTQKLIDTTAKKDIQLNDSSSDLGLDEDRLHKIVIFSIKASDTLMGEELYLCGSSPSLGEWIPQNAVRLHTDAESYPWWTAVVDLPAQPVEYKYIIQDKIRGTVRWEDFPLNRKLEPKGSWVVVEDGTFGKREQRLFTKRNVESLKKELQQKDDQIKQQLEERKAMVRELDNTKEKMLELEFLTQQLKKQLAVLEGTKLETLPTSELKDLAQKSKKTAHKANAILTKRLEDEAYHLRRLRDCSVCMDSQIDTVCLPCGHLALCEGCAGKLNSRCVICNAKVEKMQKVFLK